MVTYGGSLPKADFDSHHIEGYAHAAISQGKDGRFSAPLISHIEGNLWVGGCIGHVDLPQDFKFVISLYKWERYRLGEGTTRYEFTMYDSSDKVDSDEVNRLADLVNKCLDKGKTLVHCQAGLNRSNLVAARALIKRGRTPEEAIALLREKRSPVVLCNLTFENWLLAKETDDKITEPEGS